MVEKFNLLSRAMLGVLAGLTLVSGSGLVGCGGEACQSLTKDHRALLGAQRGALAQKARTGPGGVHVGLVVSDALVEEVVEEALSKEASGLNKALDLPLGSIKARVKIKNLEARVTDRCERCVSLGGKVMLRLEAGSGLLRLQESVFEGQLKGTAPLILSASSKGSVLSVDMGKAKLDRISVDVAGLPSALRGTVNRTVADGARTILAQLDEPLPVAEWAPFELEGSGLEVTASELLTFPDKGQIWVGFSTNLPTQATLEASPLLGSGERAAVVFAEPALSGLMSAMVASGAIPNRFNDDMKPDPKGDYRATLTSLSPDGDGLKTAFTIWHLPKSGSCFAADVEGRTTFAVRDLQKRKQARLDLAFEDMTVISTRGDDTLLKLGLWLRSAFVEETLDAKTRILTASTLKMGALGEKQLKVGRVDMGDGVIVMAGDLK